MNIIIKNGGNALYLISSIYILLFIFPLLRCLFSPTAMTGGSAVFSSPHLKCTAEHVTFYRTLLSSIVSPTRTLHHYNQMNMAVIMHHAYNSRFFFSVQ